MPSGGAGAAAPAAGTAVAEEKKEEKAEEKKEEKVSKSAWVAKALISSDRKSRMMIWASGCSIRSTCDNSLVIVILIDSVPAAGALPFQPPDPRLVIDPSNVPPFSHHALRPGQTRIRLIQPPHQGSEAEKTGKGEPRVPPSSAPGRLSHRRPAMLVTRANGVATAQVCRILF